MSSCVLLSCVCVGSGLSRTLDRGAGFRSGDSFTGPVPRSGRGTFAGDREWFRPGSESDALSDSAEHVIVAYPVATTPPIPSKSFARVRPNG